MDGRQAGILVAAVAPAELRAECDVAPVRPQSAVYLQLSVDVLVVVISHSFVLSAVDHQSLLVHLPQALGTQRVSDIVVGIAVEGCRCREVATVAGLETHIRTERQRRYRVDGPLQIHVARPVVVARIVLTDAVREGSATRIDKVLRSRLVPVVGVATRPRHSPTPLHLLVFVAGIQRCRLRLALTLVVAATTSATSREVAVVDIVGITHKRIAHGTKGFHGRQSDAVAPIRADAKVGIGLQTFAHASLGHKLQHEVVVTVVQSRHPCQVALLLVSLHLVNHIRRQVLHHCIVVARHEVATVHLEFPHALAVDADLAVVVNLRARQCLHQRLDDAALGNTEGVGIVHHRVVLHQHLRQIGGYHRLL